MPREYKCYTEIIYFDWFDYTQHKYAQYIQRGSIAVLIIILVVAVASGAYFSPGDTAEKLASMGLGGGTGGDVNLINKENIIFGDYSAIKQTSKVKLSTDNRGKGIFTTECYIDLSSDKNNPSVLTIYIYNYEGETPSKDQAIFNQILSTFKFI